MLELLVGAGVLVATAAGVAGVKVHREWTRRHVNGWTEAARMAGGRYEPKGKSWWKDVPARIVAAMEHGVEVVVDHYTVSTGKSSTTYTRIFAPAPGADELGIKLRKQGLLAAAGKALGLRDLDLGDPEFDARFLVRTGDDELARAWLDARVRAALLAMPPDWDATLADGAVKAERVGIELDPVKLVAAMRAGGALAAGGRSLVERWRVAARALGARATGLEDVFVPGRVRLTAEADGHAFVIDTGADAAWGTRVRRELGRRDAPRFELGAGGALDPRHVSGPGAEDAWQAVQPARLACDGESVVVDWTGYAPDAARVAAAMRLVAATAAAQPVPYR